MVNAKPTMNPFNTGSEMNDAMNPSRSSPASRPRIPVTMARAAVNAIYSAESPAANGATLAADSAAVADIGPTTRCRELPAAAYSTSDGIAAYKPTTGGTPAIVAYANASGTRTAQTVSPAITSARTQTRW